MTIGGTVSPFIRERMLRKHFPLRRVVRREGHIRYLNCGHSIQKLSHHKSDPKVIRCRQCTPLEEDK